MHGHFQFHYVAPQERMAELEHLVLLDLMAKQLQILQQLEVQQEQPVQQELSAQPDQQVLQVHLAVLVQRDLLDQQVAQVQQELLVHQVRQVLLFRI
jgi:hypothetical protein